MAELKVLDGATGDGSSSTYERSAVYDTTLPARQGAQTVLFKYKKTNTGTCTLTLHDGVTGAAVSSHTVGATNPEAATNSVACPGSFYVAITSAAGTFALDCYIDG